LHVGTILTHKENLMSAFKEKVDAGFQSFLGSKLAKIMSRLLRDLSNLEAMQVFDI